MIDIEENSSIRTVSLWRARRITERLDIWPFMIAYSTCFSVYFSNDVKLSLILMGGVLLLHILLALLCFWNLKIRCKVGFSSVKNIKRATHILVEPCDLFGDLMLCELVKDYQLVEGCGDEPILINDKSISPNPPYFSFCHQKYLFDEESGCFFLLPYPTFSSPFSFQGLSHKEAGRRYSLWGDNSIHLPVPPFLSLLLEHLLAPFFVFQVVCLLLWFGIFLFSQFYPSYQVLGWLCTLFRPHPPSLSLLRDVPVLPKAVPHRVPPVPQTFHPGDLDDEGRSCL